MNGADVLQTVKRSPLEAKLLNRLDRAGLPRPETEYRFARAEGRLYRFDLAWPAAVPPLAVEVQGAIWQRVGGPGRHNRASGYEKDAEKLSLAVALGWRVMPVTEKMIESGLAIRLIARALGRAER